MSASHTNRIAWIDNTKMVAMLFVMLGHTWRIIHCPLPEWLNVFILSFNMPLFVILSGYTSYNAISRIISWRDLVKFIEKLTKRMLVPAVVYTYTLRFIETIAWGGSVSGMLVLEIVGLAYCLLFLYREKPIIGQIFNIACWLAIPLAMWKSNFWFFNMLWSVAATVATAKWISESCGVMKFNMLMGAISVLLAFAMNFIHDKTTDFILFYLLGMLMYRFGIVDKMKKYLYILLFGMGGLFVIGNLDTDAFNFWDFHPLYYLENRTIDIFAYRFLASSLVCCSIILLVKKLSGLYCSFSEWGTQTLAMYMLHSTIVSVLYNLPYTAQLGDLNYMIVAILLTYMLFIASMAMIKLSRKYSITRAFVLGEKLF